jgi:quercetin dioxygenase-like cupin family protein
MWYAADADPGSKLYVGLKSGVTRSDFEAALSDGTVADAVHAIEPQVGDSIFIPSGRLHAIGAGFLIHEIQQNSDTTYRVFDWNRIGLDGKPRDLHVDQSMKSIDFEDFEPAMDRPNGSTLATCEYFSVEKLSLAEGETFGNGIRDRSSIVAVAEGEVRTEAGQTLSKGAFFLIPKGTETLTVITPSTVLRTTIPGISTRQGRGCGFQPQSHSNTTISRVETRVVGALKLEASATCRACSCSWRHREAPLGRTHDGGGTPHYTAHVTCSPRPAARVISTPVV